MKKIGRFLKNIVLTKYHDITFQSELFNNASFIKFKKISKNITLAFLTRIFLLTNVLPLKAYI